MIKDNFEKLERIKTIGDGRNGFIYLSKYNGNICILIQVKDLVPDYLDSETDDGEGFIEDNTNKGSYLDDNEILIYKENEIVKAIYITNEDKLDNKYICS